MADRKKITASATLVTAITGKSTTAEYVAALTPAVVAKEDAAIEGVIQRKSVEAKAKVAEAGTLVEEVEECIAHRAWLGKFVGNNGGILPVAWYPQNPHRALEAWLSQAISRRS